MRRLARLVRDLRNLGVGAPVRILYELSKRTPVHGIVHGTVRLRSATFRPTMPAHPPTPPIAAVTAAAAAGIRAGTLTIFERDVETGWPPQWTARLDAPGRHPDEPWWTIDIRSNGDGAAASDVKFVWELGRLESLVTLARDPHPASSAALRTGIDAWFDQSPPGRGIQWYSNLEIALRVFRWSEILARAELPSGTADRIGAELAASRRHLLIELPYTLSSMRNNHLLGDAVGIECLALDSGRRTPLSRAIAATARRTIVRFVDHHVRADGSMLDDSVSYHRFVLDMLTVRQLTRGDDITRAALVRTAQFLARLGVFDGPVPEFGDWDGGRFLVAAGDRHDLRGAVAAALSAAGTGASSAWRDQFEECAHLLPEGTPVPPEPGESDGDDIGGGIARVVRGRFTVWLKAGSGPSHQHGDLTAAFVAVDGRHVVVDAGTGTYNADPVVRNHFRGSRAHPVLVLDDTELLEPDRPFRFSTTASGTLGPPITIGDTVVMWAAHDAYERLDQPTLVIRLVAVAPQGVVVRDLVQHPGGRPCTSTIPLAPGLGWDGEAVIGDALDLDLLAPGGHEQAARWSRTLGNVVDSRSVRIEAEATEGAHWALGPRGAVIEHEVTDDGLVLGDHRLRVDLAAADPRLIHERPDGTAVTHRLPPRTAWFGTSTRRHRRRKRSP